MAAESDALAAALGDDDGDWEPLEPSLQNIIDQQSLKWVFVGGKGGVGKTTTSCCLAVRLAAARNRVLVVSTDPAHNLSDAFGQKFGRNPVQVDGYDNLFCMEVDPTFDLSELSGDGIAQDGGGAMQGMLQELMNSFPGVDEAMGFAEIMKQVQSMDYDVVVFDTAPTGHTLRLLSFPKLMESALGKLSGLGSRFGGLMQQAMAMMGAGGQGAEEQLMGRMEQLKTVIAEVNRQFQDPDRTTFVCVCIPEFLSVYETERLVQELTKFGIDSHNIVVNQILHPDEGSPCRKCLARQRHQRRYLTSIFELYGDDFHVVTMPLLDEEVRGGASLEAFSRHLLTPYDHAASGPSAE